MSFKQAILQILSLALPIMGASFLQLAYNTADIFWVGNLGSDAVAAVGTAGFYMNLAWSITNIISVGAGVKLAQSIGAKNYESAREIVRTGLSSVFVLILLISGISITFSTELIGFFDLNDQLVIQSASNYLSLVSIGFLFSFQNYFLTVIFNSYGKSKLSLKANSIGIVVNIILDPILIFGLDMGVQGAALATIISQLLTTLYYYNLLRKDAIINPLQATWNTVLLKDILKISSPIAAQRILFTIIAIIMGKIVAKYGVQAIAAQRIGFQIESLSFIMIMGIHQAVSTFSGNSFGAKQYLAISKGYRAGITLGLMYTAVVTTILVGFPEFLMRIFVEDTATVDAGKFYLMIIGLSSMFACLEMVTAGAFNGLGKTKFPAVNSIILTSLRIPVALLLSSTVLELNGVWLSISISSIFKGIVLVILYRLVLKPFIAKTYQESLS